MTPASRQRTNRCRAVTCKPLPVARQLTDRVHESLQSFSVRSPPDTRCTSAKLRRARVGCSATTNRVRRDFQRGTGSATTEIHEINFHRKFLLPSTHPKRDGVVHRLHRLVHQCSHDFIVEMLEAEAAGIIESVGHEENLAELVLELHEQPSLDRRMAEPEGGAGELVGHAGIDFIIVVAAVALRRTEKRESLHRFRPDDQRQPLVVRHVLDLRHDDPSRLLEDHIVGPVRIHFVQRLSDAVVLAGEQQVKSDQRDVLVDADVASHEASRAVHEAVVGLRVQRQQLAVEIDEHLQLAVLEAPQVLHRLHIRPVNHRSIEVVRDLRQRLRIAELAVVVRRDGEADEIHAALVERPVEVIFLVDEDRHASEVRLVRR